METDWLRRRQSICPRKVAVIDQDGHTHSYEELNLQVNKTANWLLRQGVGKGSRIAVLSTNHVAHLLLLFAAARIGAIFLPLNFRLSQAELKGIVDDGAPNVFIYHGQYSEAAHDLATGRFGTKVYKLQEFLWQLDSVSGDYPALTPVDAEEPWQLLYTGGTTGIPKGALLPHRMVTWNAINTVTGWGLEPDDVTIVFSPFFHTGGLNVLATPLLYIGGTVILREKYDAAEALNLIQRYRATVIFMVPTMYQLLSEQKGFDEADFSNIRFMITGGAPCPAPLIKRFSGKGIMFKQGFGLTEAGPNCFLMPDHQVSEFTGSVGMPMIHTRVTIRDENDHTLGPGGIGEIVLEGPHIFSGYWRRPEATANTLKDGKVYTGDLGYFDDNGLFYVVDRKKDMFISGGENVYPVEVEAAIHSHSAVLEAAVTGISDPKWGEVGKAFVVLKPGHSLTANELLGYLKGQLAKYKVPKEVEFRTELPKNAAGKVLKRQLRGE
ncbi:MAG: long-chain fatty acid--CoA ligase [Firmicutes bacterium]|nr:long-chain fatty acid--CoA ligase [Bacillota bacterium]